MESDRSGASVVPRRMLCRHHSTTCTAVPPAAHPQPHQSTGRPPRLLAWRWRQSDHHRRPGRHANLVVTRHLSTHTCRNETAACVRGPPARVHVNSHGAAPISSHPSNSPAQGQTDRDPEPCPGRRRSKSDQRRDLPGTRAPCPCIKGGGRRKRGKTAKRHRTKR